LCSLRKLHFLIRKTKDRAWKAPRLDGETQVQAATHQCEMENSIPRDEKIYPFYPNFLLQSLYRLGQPLQSRLAGSSAGRNVGCELLNGCMVGFRTVVVALIAATFSGATSWLSSSDRDPHDGEII
jgi:hypothetical protein